MAKWPYVLGTAAAGAGRVEHDSTVDLHGSV